MPRPVGCIEFQEVITIPVPRANVIQVKKDRYVFTDTFSNRVRRLCIESVGDMKLYQRFVQTVSRRRYNMVDIYGMPAINIDDPHNAVVSVWLEFEVTDAAVPEQCTYRRVKKTLGGRA